MKNLGEILRQAREKAAMTQGDLAKELGYPSAQIVSNWERGKCSIPLKQAPLFCKLTGMNPDTMAKLLVAGVTEKVNKKLGLYKKSKQKNVDL